jgi:hypothetical protein
MSNLKDKSEEQKAMAVKIIAQLDLYLEILYENKKVSATQFSHMQLALYGAKQIIRQMHGMPGESENAWIK